MSTDREPYGQPKKHLKGVAMPNPRTNLSSQRDRRRLSMTELEDIASFLYGRHEFRINRQKDKLDGKKERRNKHM